ncbi:MAG: ABC transporter ATP-binding protein/permease [Planctomycetes bacterium]|nr:ABC transporter ATP-binding protein/permease [Planctomycetota bacterium]
MTGRKYRDLLLLWPFFRPQLGLAALLLAGALAYAAFDAGRAWLVEPLVNRVFVRGGDARAQLSDEMEAQAPKAAVDAAIDAVPAPPPEEVEAVRRDPRLGVPPLPGVAADLGALLRRTDETLARVADDLAAEQVDPALWTALARAARVQARAVALAPDDPALATGLSLRARRQAYEVVYASVQGTLHRIVVIALLLALGLAVAEYVTAFFSRLITIRVFFDVQARLAAHLLTLPLSFYDRERRGDLLSRLTTDLHQLSILVTSLTSDLVVQLVRLLVLIGAALVLSWQLTVVSVLLGGGVLWPLRLSARKLRRASRRRMTAMGDLLEALQQLLSGMRTVKAFQREDHERRRLERQAAETRDAQIASVRAREGAKAWVQVMNDVTLPLIVLAMSFVVLNRWWGLSTGTLGAFLGLLLLMYLPIRGLGEAMNHVHDSQAALERVFELFEQRPEAPDAPGAAPLDRIREELRFEGVSFRYDGAGEGAAGLALRDVSFSARVGTTVAIVGATGSGKSTLIDLLTWLRDPTSGAILVDGVDRRAFTRASYLDRLTVVPQAQFLFRGTVRENIRYGRLDATDAEVEAAAKLAGVHEDVMALADGYDHDVGERGGKLSGGQVQRVALARAFLRDADVIVLDEGTSALDTRTERAVQQALATVAPRAITVVVAHRLSTVLRADQILVLDQGQVVERGTHQELVALGGAYARLVALQALGGEGERPAA